MPTYEVHLRVFVTAKSDDDAFDAAGDLDVECFPEAEIDVEQIGKARRVRRPRRFTKPGEPATVLHYEAAEGEGK